MLGIYFSGTGNTKYCVEAFVSQVDQNATCLSIENPETLSLLSKEEEIVFGYPIYFSNIPVFVRDFIVNHKDLFEGKRIFIITTMGLFSGDGAGCSARIFKKVPATVVGGLHVKMPDCVGDNPLLKKSIEKNQRLIEQATKKITKAGQNYKGGRPTQNGLSVPSHLLGLLGQRLWFYGETKNYQAKPTIDKVKCIGCGKCVGLCPTKNLTLQGGKARQGEQCTICYRCVNFCPTQALTILGKKVYEQVYLEKYLLVSNAKEQK